MVLNSNFSIKLNLCTLRLILRILLRPLSQPLWISPTTHSLILTTQAPYSNTMTTRSLSSSPIYFNSPLDSSLQHYQCQPPHHSNILVLLIRNSKKIMKMKKTCLPVEKWCLDPKSAIQSSVTTTEATKHTSETNWTFSLNSNIKTPSRIKRTKKLQEERLRKTEPFKEQTKQDGEVITDLIYEILSMHIC